MSEAVSRELILPGTRLDLPRRPSGRELAVLAERSADQWTTAPADLATAYVVRLAVAALLESRLQRRPGVAERTPLPDDPAEVTLAQLATLFRPHVDLTRQAFELAVVEAVNAAVPAAVDPLRDGLRRVGVTGRDPVRVVALGLDKLPTRARQSFWEGVRTSDTVTAVVDAAATRRTGDQGRAHDVSGLDRSELSRADALVIAGGRTTAVAFGARQGGGRPTWLDVPLTVVRGERRGEPVNRRPERSGGSGAGVEVALRGEGWVEALETALDALAAAMRHLDTGAKLGGAGARGLSGALAGRLGAAGERSVADVVASLRDIEPTALELLGHQVTTTAVPVAVPVVDDELFVQLWLPTSALAGPLVTGSADLFLGGPAQVRSDGGSRPGRGENGGRGEGGRGPDGRGEGRGGRSRPEQGRGQGRPRPEAAPAAEPGAEGDEAPARTGRGKRRGGRGRGRGPAAPDTGDSTPDGTGAPAVTGGERSEGSEGSDPVPAPEQPVPPAVPAPDPAPTAPAAPAPTTGDGGGADTPASPPPE